ncbi:hypothetical protein [Oryza sativa Japonica Group]|uniref:Uncharacterized protein n=1 Tax=Oryza sativa subsp. japonica TaxID=39947 RepID=Q5N9V0_ORYSJ|nr:hypothetical protein [Oryza sativa Japonica Group]
MVFLGEPCSALGAKASKLHVWLSRLRELTFAATCVPLTVSAGSPARKWPEQSTLGWTSHSHDVLKRTAQGYGKCKRDVACMEASEESSPGY